MKVNLNPKFSKLWTTNKRYILVTGGRGSGKSFGVSVYLTEQSYNDHFKALFTRFTMKSAHDSIIPELTSKIELLGLKSDFHETKEDVINTQTDNQIMFRGIKTSSGDQTANLKSLEGVTHFIVDEAEEFKEEEKFNTINLSIRTTLAPNKVIVILNPSDTNHWVYSRWLKSTHKMVDIDGFQVPISTHPDVEHIHSTYLDNINNLSPDFLKELGQMKIDAPDYYGHKIIGQWADHAEGALLKKYNEFALSEIRPESNLIAYIDVADEGLDYTCMVIAKIQDRKLYIVDVIYTDLNTDVAHPLCLAAANKWKPKYIMCESNNMGAIFGRGLRESYKYGDLILKNSTQNKHTRIIMSIMFINSYVHFLRQEDRSPEYQKYLDAVLSYDKDPKNNKHDDAMDATSGLSRLATSYYDGIFKNKF